MGFRMASLSRRAGFRFEKREKPTGTAADPILPLMEHRNGDSVSTGIRRAVPKRIYLKADLMITTKLAGGR